MNAARAFEALTLNRSREKKQDRIALWFLFALIVFAPLPLASNRPWSLALLGVLTGFLLLWTLWRPSGRSLVSVWHHARTPIVLLGLWMALLLMQLVPLLNIGSAGLGSTSALALHGVDGRISIDPYSTRLYLAKAFTLSVVFWLVLTLIDSRRRMKWLAGVIVFSGLLQALIGIGLMATGTNVYLFFIEIAQPRAHGTFISPNQYAGYLELTLAMGIGLMIAKLEGRSAVNWRQRLRGWLAVLLSNKVVLRVAIIIMVVGLVASRSRGGNSAFFTSLLIIGVLTVLSLKRKSGRIARATNLMHATIIFIVSLIVLDVVIIGGMVGVEKVVQRIEHTNLMTQAARIQRRAVQSDGANPLPLTSYHVEESVEERGQAVIPSLEIVRDFPWFGTGGGTFYFSFQSYRPMSVLQIYDHPHNDYVEFACDSGLVGFLLLAVLVLHSIWRSFCLLLDSRDQLSQGMVFASLMGVTSLMIHATVDFNFQNPTNAMLFLILLALPYTLPDLRAGRVL
ncbi:MAG: O-antigen ligase family protein [Gallionella sp.]